MTTHLHFTLPFQILVNKVSEFIMTLILRCLRPQKNIFCSSDDATYFLGHGQKIISEKNWALNAIWYAHLSMQESTKNYWAKKKLLTESISPHFLSFISGSLVPSGLTSGLLPGKNQILINHPLSGNGQEKSSVLGFPKDDDDGQNCLCLFPNAKGKFLVRQLFRTFRLGLSFSLP